MRKEFGIRFYLVFFVFFYSKCNLCNKNNYIFNEELSNIKFIGSNVSIFNSEYFFNITLENNSTFTLYYNNITNITLQIQINNTSNVSFIEINRTSNKSFNNNIEYPIINKTSFYNIIKSKNNLFFICINQTSYNTNLNNNITCFNKYSYQSILNNECEFYGNFFIICGIIISLYGYKMKSLIKIIFIIFLLNSLSEFIEENFIKANITEITCLEISIGCLILGIFLGIILPKKEFISYGIIFGLTFYQTICYYFLFIFFPNLISIFQIIGFFFILISIIITQIFNNNEILFIIGTSISGAYFVISGLNCFLGGFYYVEFLKKDFYDKDKFKNCLLFYCILNIFFICVGIIYQIYYKKIEIKETKEIEKAKKMINKNFSGSTFIVDPNKTNQYNVSLTTNKNQNVDKENDENEEEKEFEDENDNKLLNESYH